MLHPQLAGQQWLWPSGFADLLNSVQENAKMRVVLRLLQRSVEDSAAKKQGLVCHW